jgi:hypothetical protein
MSRAEGKIGSAWIAVDIKPHKGNVDLFFDYENIQRLCETHHNRTSHARSKDASKPWGCMDGRPDK